MFKLYQVFLKLFFKKKPGKAFAECQKDTIKIIFKKIIQLMVDTRLNTENVNIGI